MTAWQALGATVQDPLFVIGDIHGRLDLLDLMLAKIDAEARKDPHKIIVLGDMIDRGPDSAAVLRRLKERSDVICLMGNHERMMLDFVKDPSGEGARWLRNGGDTTMSSFGIKTIGTGRLDALRDRLADAAGLELLEWVDELPLLWTSKNVAVAHAGMDPKASPTKQKRTSLIWGHRRFLKQARKDGLVVVHGHWQSDEPGFGEGRISVDTGAWHSGVLSAAELRDEKLRFLQVRGAAVA